MLFSKIMYGVIITSFIIIFLLFILIENDARDKIRNELLNDQKIHGETMTRHNSHLISNEFSIILQKQKELAFYAEHSQDNLSLDLSELALDTYNDIESRMDIFALSITDKDNVIKIRVKNGMLTEEFVGQDSSEITFVKEFNEEHKPLISGVFLGLDDNLHVGSSYPIFDEYDELIGSIHVIINPTSFFRSYDDLYGLSSDVITIIDKNQRIVKYSIPELLGENIFDKKIQSQLNIGESDNEINELMRKSFSGDDVSFISEFNGSKKLIFMQPIFVNDEQIFTIILSIPLEKIYLKSQSILLGAEYAVFILIGVTGSIILISFHFIQKQYSKREELQQFSVIGELSSRISHDIRNPLSVIKMITENMKIHHKSDPKQLEQIKKMDNAIDRINHQIEEVLDFVRKQPIKLSKVSINEIISESLNSLVIPEDTKIISSENDIEIICDKKQLLVVMNNLILNSIQIINGSGTVEITSKEDNKVSVIQVKDSGKGIPKENIKKIFEPLFTTKQQGTGLGLASVKSIIESHGGTISVTSPPTIFTITLPKSNS